MQAPAGSPCVNGIPTDAATARGGTCSTPTVVLTDFVAPAVDLGPYGNAYPAGYWLYLRQCVSPCESVMPQDCVQRLGVLGCYTHMYWEKTQTGSPAAQVPGSAPPGLSPTGKDRSGDVGSADHSSGPSQAALIGGIVGGVLGGACRPYAGRCSPLRP
jgi:hypothetical protein